MRKMATRSKGKKTRMARKTTKAKVVRKAAAKSLVKGSVGKGSVARGSVAKRSVAKRSVITSSAEGPVTLAEARALSQAKRPKLALRKAAVGPATPEQVGQARNEVGKRYRDEIAQRVRDYTATMMILKQRGARRPEPKRAVKTARVAAKSGGFVPLQVLAEGDSWFDYPPFLLHGGIIPRLESRIGVPILSLAKAGDEVRYMLGVEEREILAEHLRNGCPAGGPWDVLLFSGGGNDIVDNPMALWIRDWQRGVPPEKLLFQSRFDSALALVQAGYEDLITLRNQLSPTTHVVFHGYDFAIPDGRGVCFLGPWLKPTFDLRRFPSQKAGAEVIRVMLAQFAKLLTSLAKQSGVTFINTQGTLKPKRESWHNELHPSADGFDLFADLFQQQLKRLFPSRVA